MKERCQQCPRTGVLRMALLGVFLGTIDHDWNAQGAVYQRTSNPPASNCWVTRNQNHDVVSTWHDSGCKDAEICTLNHNMCKAEMGAVISATYWVVVNGVAVGVEMYGRKSIPRGTMVSLLGAVGY
jgi:hypothetical protein